MEVFLHHTTESPFAELLRAVLGFKICAYGSVLVPDVLPKPGLAALTGGYARTPVVQIGADVFCDTAAILPALDARFPVPPLYPPPLGDLHVMLAGWAGAAQFIAHIGVAFAAMPPGALSREFQDDRKARFGLDIPKLTAGLAHLTSQVLAGTTILETVLGDGRPFVGGEAAGHADFALYANLWFVHRNASGTAAGRAIAAMPQVSAWYDRMAGFGHGSPSDATASDALAVARAATPDLSEAVDLSFGFRAGQAVRIGTEGSRDTPVFGHLLRMSGRGVAIARELEGGGTVAITFPRLGQLVLPT